MDGQINLFNDGIFSDEGGIYEEKKMFSVIKGDGLLTDGPLNVTRVSYLGKEYNSFDEIFMGFNEIRVVTFSYGLGFISNIMHRFDYGEIIVGCHAMVKHDLEGLINLQAVVTNVKCADTYLSKRILDDELKLFVIKEFVVHDKIYLLKADDGRTRVIYSSANGSERAWSGEQHECYIICDDRACYEDEIMAFETLRDLSTNEILKNAEKISEDLDNIEELPICKEIRAKETMVVKERSKVDEEYEYVVKTEERLQKKIEETFKAARLTFNVKKGAVLITAKHVTDVIMASKRIKQENITRRQKSPQLVIDCMSKTATYNDKALNLLHDEEEVKKDARNIIDYFNGFKNSIGDMEDTLSKYWKALIYMYLVPIIPQMRYIWGELGHEESRSFPIYLLLTGPSDSGKSHFIQMVQKSMLGRKLKKLHESCFTGSTEKEKKGQLTISALSSNAKGVPLFIDEMTSMYWKYADNIVKFDRVFDGEEEYRFRPCYVIASNKIESNTKEVTKRVVRFDVTNRFPEDFVLNNTDDERIIRELGNAFYLEFVRRVLDKIDDFIEDMKIKSDNSEEPDIFEFGALTLIETFADFGFVIPEGLSAFNKYDYIGGKNRCDKALKMLKEEYAINPDIFLITPERNQIEIDFSSYDRKESERRIKVLSNELPNILDCQNRGSRVTLRYRETEQETGMSFRTKRRFWWRK